MLRLKKWEYPGAAGMTAIFSSIPLGRLKDVIYLVIHTYGMDDRLKFCKQMLANISISGIERILLLPIPTTKDGNTLNGTPYSIEDFNQSILPGDVIVGYGLPRSTRYSSSLVGAVIVDCEMNEEYLLKNAALTAIGCAVRLLSESKVAPADQHYGIIGYGRIGEKLTHILMFLGARVTVFTSKEEIREELSAIGVSSVSTAERDMSEATVQFSELDVLINTAPARLIPPSAFDLLSDKLIVELASGDNIPHGVPYERYAAIPAKMYPKSAGRVLAETVLQMLGIASTQL